MRTPSLESSRSNRIAVIALVVISAAVALFGAHTVGRHHALVRVSYELSEIEGALRDAEEHNRRLRLERALLTAPARIEQLAAELGMVHPQPDQIRVLGWPQVAKSDDSGTGPGEER